MKVGSTATPTPVRSMAAAALISAPRPTPWWTAAGQRRAGQRLLAVP
jgi:hypothetical protein